MVTTIRLINIPTPHSYLCVCVCVCVCVQEHLKSTLLATFKYTTQYC